MSAGQQNRVTVVPLGDREFTAERIFDAPRDRVFAAYTDPELIPQWWGPEGSATTVDYADSPPAAAAASSATTTRATRSPSRAREERDGMLGSGMEQGFGETLDRLERLLAQ